MVERRTENPCVASSILALGTGLCPNHWLGLRPVNNFSLRGVVLLTDNTKSRGVAQLARASALGAEGRRFKSCRPDERSEEWRSEQIVLLAPGFERRSDVW